MDRLAIARQRLLAAALGYAASDLYLDTELPGPHDAAEMELRSNMLDEAVEEYVSAKVRCG